MESDDALAEMLATQVALGVEPFDVVVELGVEYLADEAKDDTSDEASDGAGDDTGAEPDADADAEDDAALVARVWLKADELFANHVAAQRSWPDITDSDRLTRAFRDLDIAGIVAREDFTCCQNCGHTEIRDEYSPGQYPRGYVFYHQQDADSGAAGEGIYLAYDGDNQKAVGREIVAALKARGLRPEWNGSTGTRIKVPLIWQRKRLGRLAAHPGTIDAEDFAVEVEPLAGWAGPPVAAGATSAKAWAALRLPWLPTGRSVRITVPDGETVVVQREWDRLIGTYAQGWVAETPRSEAWPLLARLGDTPYRPKTTVEPEPMLEVSYEHTAGTSDGLIPMTIGESLALLRQIPVRTGSWATYTSRSGAVVQHVWEDGPKLWLEVLDPPERASHGRHVTIEQAQRVIRILAEEDRVVMAPLGRLETRFW